MRVRDFFGIGYGAAFFRMRQPPQLRRVDVPIRGLPAGLQGFTIGHLSDIHRSILVSEHYVGSAVDVLNGLRPDVIVLTGDFVTKYSGYVNTLAVDIARLHAPLGVFAVLGNHDYACGGVDEVRTVLERDGGVRWLTNQAVRLEHGGEQLWLAGTDDMWEGSPDLDAAFAGVPQGATRVLLSHCPDIANDAARYGVALQLSGHTHGPQINLWPMNRVLPKFGKKYPCGLARVAGHDCWVYTNVGLGALTLPVRINQPPEIALLKLVASEG
jgi:predicted MPP superfamily phosphohydrolase